MLRQSFCRGKRLQTASYGEDFSPKIALILLQKTGQKCLESVTKGGLFRRWRSFTRHTVLSAGYRGGPSRAAEGDADFPSLSNDRFAAAAPGRHKTQAAASVPGYRSRELFFGNSGGVSYGGTDRHHAPATTSQRPPLSAPICFIRFASFSEKTMLSVLHIQFYNFRRIRTYRKISRINDSNFIRQNIYSTNILQSNQIIKLSLKTILLFISSSIGHLF